jgi:very-short-patch-repair endonuclease
MSSGSPVRRGAGRGRVLAATLVAGGLSAASHRTAAVLWRMPGVQPNGVEIVQRRDLNHERPLAVVHQVRWLTDAHVRDLGGIPVVAPAPTLFQLSAREHPLLVERLMEHALDEKLVTTVALAQTAEELCRKGRAGSALFRSLVLERGEGYVALASDLEARFLRLIRKAGLPEPARQVNAGGEAWIARVDFLYRWARLIIELDGRKHHTQLLARRRDRLRSVELTRAGFRVIPFTWSDLCDEPEWVIAVLRDLLVLAA